MAITTSFEQLKQKFNPNYWSSIDEFEEYFLQNLSEKLPDTNYYTDRNGIERTIKPIDHYPELKEYEVWVEGYAATGESGGASLVGKARARNFAQACHIVMCNRYLKSYKLERDTPGRWDYDPSRLSYWGCGLFWSEYLAKKTFG